MERNPIKPHSLGDACTPAYGLSLRVLGALHNDTPLDRDPSIKSSSGQRGRFADSPVKTATEHKNTYETTTPTDHTNAS